VFQRNLHISGIYLSTAIVRERANDMRLAIRRYAIDDGRSASSTIDTSTIADRRARVDPLGRGRIGCVRTSRPRRTTVVAIFSNTCACHH
jgi:hypothetical protein